MRTTVITHFVSPYQIELFNTVAIKLELSIVYLHKVFRTRSWFLPSFKHEAVCLDEEPNRFDEALEGIRGTDLVVFNYYVEKPAQILLNVRAASGKPWCFWGERPGFRKPEWLGSLRRQWKLAHLHASSAPIWGIGRFAVEAYQKEFGACRSYYNLPYYSDLSRFQINGPRDYAEGTRVFLFSGSLIHRKGVDLLAHAFLRLAREMLNVRLRFLGDGELHSVVAKILQPVKDRVEFLGFQDWPALPACYAAADVLCVPSRYDGWGLVVPEGLAAGLPVIGTDRMGAALEFVETGYNGWLLPAGNEDALYHALREAALLPAERLAELSCNACKSVREHSLQNGATRFIRAAQEAYKNWEE